MEDDNGLVVIIIVASGAILFWIVSILSVFFKSRDPDDEEGFYDDNFM